MKEEEWVILRYMFDYMNYKGHKAGEFSIPFDDMASSIRNKSKKYTTKQLMVAVKKCCSAGYLCKRSLSFTDAVLTDSRAILAICDLQITEQGVEVIRSKQQFEYDRASRNWGKKFSDCMSEYKGLFIPLAFILTLASLLMRFLLSNFNR